MSDRLKLLAICYHFPPVGSAGTGRSVRLLPGLEDHGIDTTVVTIDPEGWGTGRFTLDLSHTATVADVPTIRVDDSGLRYCVQRRWPSKHKFLWYAAYPAFLDYASAWSARLRRMRNRLAASTSPDAVYVSVPPFSAIEAARAIAEASQAALIIDYRDPWTTASLAAHPSRWHFRWERRKERKLLQRADQVILNTIEARHLLADMDARFESSAVIPNGATAVARDDRSGPRLRSNDRFRLLFAGTLYENRIVTSRLGLYRPAAIDEGARSLRPLIRALPLLAKADPDAFRRLEIVVAGFTPDSEREAVEHAGLGGRFTFVGAVEHTEAIRLLHDADALYLNQVAYVDRSKPMPHVPGKTYEYLASGRPILAALAPGATRRMLEQEPAARVCDLDDVDALSNELRLLVRADPSLPVSPSTATKTVPGPPQLADVVRAALGEACDRQEVDPAPKRQKATQ